MIPAKFLSALQVEQLAEDRWRLLSSLRYQSAVLRAIIVAPEGFISDFESVPRWLPLVYATLYGGAHAAGVIHDLLYQTHIAADQGVADDVLYEAMGAEGPGIVAVPAWKRQIIWAGVRLGGAAAYASGPRRFQVLGNRLG